MKLDADALAVLARLTDAWVELPDDQRVAWQLEAMRRYPALARAIAAFTASAVDAPALPPLTLVADDDREDSPDFMAGQRIGPYRLLREIGRGGMGVVWLAEQSDGQLERTVALKLPLQQVNRQGLRTRFWRERNILASLDHPGIAKLFDAGVTVDGQPYMAMQFVGGKPLTHYCDEHRLDIPARIRLFIELLDAVQHAHSALIVHRDLKPSNILVTDERRVLLLDFGIAKLLDSDITAGAVGAPSLAGAQTEFVGTALTLDYASPEQVAGQSVGTRTDIYSLGVVLHELLVGRRPYHVRRASRAAMEEAVLEQDVAPLSRRITAPLAQQRSTSVRALVRTVRGDLDAVVRKALGKSLDSRYATAQAFAEDLQRWLRQEPVSAQPDRLGYRMRRLLARRWRVFSVAGVVVVAIVGTSVVAVREAIDAQRSSQVARDEARKATVITEFLRDLFDSNSIGQSDPEAARKRTAQELLDDGARRIPEALRDAPEQQIELMHMMDAMYYGMRLPESSLRLVEQAADVARKFYGANHPKALTEVARWALQAYALDDYESGDRALAQLEPHLARLVAAKDLESRRAAALTYEARLHRDVFVHVADALATARATERLYATLPEFEIGTARHNLLGVAYFKNFDFAGAQRHMTRSVQLLDAQGPVVWGSPSHPGWLAQLQALTGHYSAAEASFIRANRVERHADAGSTRIDDWVLARYVRFLVDTGRASAALELLRTGGVGVDPRTRAAITQLSRSVAARSTVLTRLGPVEEALKLSERPLDLHYPPFEQIEANLELGRLTPAQDLLETARDQLLQVGALGTLDARRYWRSRVILAIGRQDAADARATLDQSHLYLAPPGAGLAEQALVEWLDATVEQMQGQHARARQRIDAILERIAQAQERPFLREWEARLQESLGVSLASLGDTHAARQALGIAQAQYRQLFDPQTSLLVARVALRLAALERQTGHPARGQVLQAQADAIQRRHPLFERWMFL